METPPIPTQHDVLFGRGQIINTHEGNQRYRSLVEQKKALFLQSAKRKEKRAIAAQIIGEVRNAQGRFLMLCPDNQPVRAGDVERDGVDGVHPSILEKSWVIVDDERVKDKVMHSLRDKKASLGKDSVSGKGGEGGGSRSEHSAVESKSGIAQPAVGSAEMGGESEFSDLDAVALDDIFSSEASSAQYDEGGESGGSRAGGASQEAGGASQADGELDDEVFAFLRDFSNQHDDDAAQQLQEMTLRQWIECSNPWVEGEVDPPGHEVYEYVRSALPIALKLMDFLIEAQKEEKGGLQNPIPLESLVPESVSVLFRSKSPSPTVLDGGDIQYVTIMSSIGDDVDAGSVSDRLYSIGCILYELFSGASLLGESVHGEVDAPSSVPSFNSMKLGSGIQIGEQRTRKKSSRLMSLDCITALQYKGIPNSVCDLIRDLLDAQSGDFSSDTAFTSLEDVRLDINLMMRDHQRFLANMKTTPMPELTIPSAKLYGRENDVQALEAAYDLHRKGKCSGVIITGRAGVGKSALAMHVRSLEESNDYFLVAKFDQNKDASMPLLNIGSVFNGLCDMIAEDASSSQLASLEEALDGALGNQASLLFAVVPSLRKLLPTCAQLPASDDYENAATSLRFLLSELLRVVSLYTNRQIVLVFDDLQWADAKNLLMIQTIVSNFEGRRSPVFFLCCYRDDAVDSNEPLKQWLTSMSMTTFESIDIGNLSIDGVNSLVHEMLHLSPRITRPLSSVLHRKAGGGNPLFLRQIIESLKESGSICFDLGTQKFAWDLDRIYETQISDDVVGLLIGEMQKLEPDQQQALKVLSCIGSTVKCSVLTILSGEMQLNLQSLEGLSLKGFLEKDKNTGAIRWAHDKIQEAAKALMTEQVLRETHMMIGLGLCSKSLDGSAEHSREGDQENDESTQGNDEMFFIAVSQMNKAGPSVVQDLRQNEIIARLNLKAGVKAILLSDFNAAFKLFANGIQFLNSIGNHWQSQYALSVDLYNHAAEAACMINNTDAVMSFSETLIANARSYDDKLASLYSVAKSQRHAELMEQSIATTLSIFVEVGEPPPRRMGDETLAAELNEMERTLQGMTDEHICNMPKMPDSKTLTLMKLYDNLMTILYFTEPGLAGSVTLRMIHFTLTHGLNPLAPAAFAHYGEALIALGKVELACRFGRLALKLLDGSSASTSKTICYAYQVLWLSTPLQACVDAHVLGHKSGRQTGDFFHANLNLALSLVTGLSVGVDLSTLRQRTKDFVLNSQTNFAFASHIDMIHSLTVALMEGSECLPLLPSDKIIKHPLLMLRAKIHNAMKMILLGPLDEGTDVNVFEDIVEQKHQIRPIQLMGMFYEGLLCFEFARRAGGRANVARSAYGRYQWMAKGESILQQMEKWAVHCQWNFEHKCLLLQALRMHAMDSFDQAGEYYMKALKSAKEHKFIHDEAVSAELTGTFYYERGDLNKSHELLLHSKQCYERWGATAVARRVETTLLSKKFELGPGLKPFGVVLQNDSTTKRKVTDVGDEG